MAVPYVVRKKADLTSGERKELWYGVPKKLIDPIRNREFAEYMEKRSGFHRGQIGLFVKFGGTSSIVNKESWLSVVYFLPYCTSAFLAL